MSYLAKVYCVFIASPADVADERETIRTIVWNWNSINAASRGIMLEPVGWETHSVPELGGRPQAIINKQILEESDLLIAVFWTRIGTATGAHPSGTVEEIEEHVAAGKPAMIYFSDTPVRRDSVDDAQYGALREFRQQLQNRGLVVSYSGLPDFTEKLTRQLHRRLNDTSRFYGPERHTIADIETNAGRNAMMLLPSCVRPSSGTVRSQSSGTLAVYIFKSGRISSIPRPPVCLRSGEVPLRNLSTPDTSALWVTRERYSR